MKSDIKDIIGAICFFLAFIISLSSFGILKNNIFGYVCILSIFLFMLMILKVQGQSYEQIISDMEG